MFNRLIPSAVLVGVLLLCLFSLGAGSLTGFVLLAAFLAGVFLLANPDLPAIGAIALYFSHISPWMLPAAMTASNSLMLIYVVLVFAAMFLGARPIQTQDRSAKLAYLYAGLLVLLMVVRGSGFRILGSDTWGGTFYVAQFAVVGFFVLLPSARLSPRQWKVMLPAMAALSAVRPAADVLFFVSGGRIQQQYMLVKAEVGGLQLGMQALRSPAGFGSDVFRLHSASLVGIMFVLAALYLFASGRGRRWTALLVAFVGVGLCGASGYRANMILLALLPVAYIVIGKRPERIARLFGLGAAAGVLYTVLIAASPRMPAPLQRMLSVLPGAEVSHAVDVAGRSTIEWRLELWRRAAADIPEYFWVGKGLVFKQSEYEMLTAMTSVAGDSYEYQIWSREYHNGALALLLDLGCPGALLCTWLMFAILREGKRGMAGQWYDASLGLYHHVALTYYVSSVVMFWLSFGDVRSVLGFLFMGSVLKGLRLADARAAQQAARTETASLQPSAV